ncbi:MAG: glycosyltransferase family 1 protein [Lachnospiraceae bacterium]
MVHIVGNLAPGGMGSFLMNVYKKIDRNKVQFDFIVMGEKEVNYHKEAEELGAKIYKITPLSTNPLKYFMEIKNIIKNNSYEVVFRHTDIATVAIDLLAAKLGGAKERIPHSHSTDAKHVTIHKMMRPFLVALSTKRYACSKPAGKWMFKKASYTLVKNGIDLSKYSFDIEKREIMRKELQIEDKFVIGHVGNFVKAKNHGFILEIVSEIAKIKGKENMTLLLVGDGELRETIEEKIKALELEECVQLLGIRENVADLLQAMDCYLFPSVYEGLPVALVEAQAIGLPCFISDTIAKEIKMTEYLYIKDLDMGAKNWANFIMDHQRPRQAGDIVVLEECGYDIMDTVKKYEEL